MNKRIEELAVQAGDYVNETYTGPVPATFTGNSEWHKEFDKWTRFNEKFAELIVQECIAMADDFEWDDGRRGLVDRMKQNFGVEE